MTTQGPDDDDDDDDEEGWEECMEDDAMITECLCLFCQDKLASPEAVIMHCKVKHRFDISRVHKQHRLDCFGYIKMVNYIRSTVSYYQCCTQFTLSQFNSFGKSFYFKSIPFNLPNSVENNVHVLLYQAG